MAGRAPAGARGTGGGDAVSLFLCGDVMTGRGVDQALPHPGDSRLCEPYVRSADRYLRLAEAANGPVPTPVDFAYPWGDALEALDRARPDARIVNLETSVTTSDHCLPKGINYKMNPANVPCLAAAGIDCCVLANNHVLDWGEAGLVETLETLDAAGLARAGAGRGRAEAEAPAAIDVAGGRVLVFGLASETSGVPGDWAAAEDAPGVALLDDLSPRAAARVGARARAAKRPGDVVVASIHWGPNWGYAVSRAERAFAHALIESGAVDVVHGHSSHHPKAIEVHRGKPILYGCGDFLNDYEGIGGHEAFRGDLALMYVATIDRARGVLSGLAMTPFQIRNLRLNRASRADAEWLAATLDRECRAFGGRVRLDDAGRLHLAWD